MPEPASNLAERVLGTARNHLKEWDIGAPLDVANELAPDGDLQPSTDPAFRGYANWADRMDSLNLSEMIVRVNTIDRNEGHPTVAPLIAQRLDDPAAEPTIIAAVDYIALMENALLSLGLMMTYLPLDGEPARQLFCLHRFDVLQRLVSATDRLRAVCLHGVYGLDGEQVGTFSRDHPYHAAFIMRESRLEALDLPPRKQGYDRRAFKAAYLELVPFVQRYKAPIRRLRRERNVATHVLGTHPGESVKKRADRRRDLDVPYVGSIYEAFGHSIAHRDEFEGQLDDAKTDYEQVLRFGSRVFELDNLVYAGSE